MTTRSRQRSPFTVQLFSRRSLFLIGLFILTFSAVPVHGETPTEAKRHEKPYALIFGTVWGPDSRPVYGVTVRVRLASEKKPKWELHSDHNGEFALRVPAGKADYSVWADLKGFKSSNGKQLDPGPEVTVHIDNDERADIGLHLK